MKYRFRTIANGPEPVFHEYKSKSKSKHKHKIKSLIYKCKVK